MMSELIDQLTDLLESELGIFNRFLELLDQQHRFLVKRDLDNLNRVNSELDILSNHASGLERQRHKLVATLSREMALGSPHARLSDLLRRVDNQAAERLRELRQMIIDVHRRIAEKSQRNKFLIDRSRFLIAETMRLLAQRPKPAYEKPVAAAPTADGQLVNRSV